MCEGFYPIKAKGEIYVSSPVYLGLFILIYSVCWVKEFLKYKEELLIGQGNRHERWRVIFSRLSCVNDQSKVILFTQSACSLCVHSVPFRIAVAKIVPNIVHLVFST